MKLSSKIALIVFISILGFIALVYIGVNALQGTPQSTRTIPEQFVFNEEYKVIDDDYVEPSKEQVEWFNDMAYSVLYSASKEYPSQSIRSLMHTALLANGDDYRILLSDGQGYLNATASTSHHDTGPTITIMFYVSALKDLQNFYANQEDYEDALISIFLHEYRHTQQDWADQFIKPSPDWVLYGRESDAQWYVAENVLKPMRDAGRLNPDVLKADNASLDAYLEADGDQGNQAWQRHASEYSRQVSD